MREHGIATTYVQLTHTYSRSEWLVAGGLIQLSGRLKNEWI
jgi:hypothetical protein